MRVLAPYVLHGVHFHRSFVVMKQVLYQTPRYDYGVLFAAREIDVVLLIIALGEQSPIAIAYVDV